LVDLRIDFAGVEFPNPVVVAAGEPGLSGKHLEKCAKSGAGGLVTKTIRIQSGPEILSFIPRPRFWMVKSTGHTIGMMNVAGSSDIEPKKWVEDEIPIARKAGIPLIVSINAGSEIEHWTRLAKMMDEAGADMLELDFACLFTYAKWGLKVPLSHDPILAAEVVRAIKRCVSIPVMVKLPAEVLSLGEIAGTVEKAGADAVSAINTIRGFAGVNINTGIPYLPHLSGYSGPAIKPIALRSVIEVAKAVDIPVSGIGGLMNWEDAIEMMMVGASTVQVCTAILWKGVGVIGHIVKGIEKFLEEKGYTTPKEIVGKALEYVVPYGELEVHPLKANVNLGTCTGPRCGICASVCVYDAIRSRNGKIKVDLGKCKGCGLCLQLCPVGAIELRI